MMSEKKARVEPEMNAPGAEGADGDGMRESAADADRQRSIEEVVAELESHIEREDGDAGQADEPEVERIAALEAEVAALRDKWTRALAEAENVRRRADRDRRDAEAYGGTRLARDILTVWDNLERAIRAADERLKAEHGAFLEGVELTQRELLNAFAKHKIEKVTPAKGDRFDPNLHQAMFEAPVPGAESGTVLEVLQDGFTIADRLLRPALVGVARAAPEAPPAGSSEEGGPLGQDAERADAPESTSGTEGGGAS